MHQKACIQDFFASVCMLFLCGDIILQFYFRIMAFLTFLRIRFGISSLSPQILTLPQLPCNPKGSSPYNFHFRLPHAGESHLHTFRSHRHHRLSFQIRYLSFRFGSLIKRGYQKANTIRIIIIRFLVIIAQSKHCILDGSSVADCDNHASLSAIFLHSPLLR